MKYFASDNNSGVHPRILQAMQRVNVGNEPSYGEDRYTEEAVEVLRQTFGEHARPWFVFLGTAGNVLGLKSMLQPYQAVICTEEAHIHCDECGALEAITGCKLFTVPSAGGKIRLNDCLPLLTLRESVHHSYPKVLSITQSTECGTLYSIEELRAIRKFCDEHKLFLHMDGARLCNAAAALGCSLKEISTDVGVDVLTFGGTKNGLMFGEVIVFLNEALGHSFAYIRKQNMQLVSKMRYMAVQFLEFLHDGLWLENARRANDMAAMLAQAIHGLPHVRFVNPVEVNALFVRMPENVIAKLREDFYFYTLDNSDSSGWPLVRLMTSFNTTEEEVSVFAEAIKACSGE